MTYTSPADTPATTTDPLHAELARRTDGLRTALELGGDTLREETVQNAQALLERVDQRMRLGE